MRNSDKNLTKILQNLKVEEVSIVSFESALFLQRIGKYLPYISRFSCKAELVVTIQKFKISALQMGRLLSAYRHVKQLEIQECNVACFYIPNFFNALVDTKIKVLDFYLTGGYNFSNWKTYSHEFENLISALGNTHLSYSLEAIYLECSELVETYVRKVLDDFGLPNVRPKGCVNVQKFSSGSESDDSSDDD